MFQIEQLIIIGAPSCAGKSYLIEKIQRGDYPHLCAQLGIFNQSSWHFLTAADLNHMRQPIIGRVVVHYDLYFQYSQDNGFGYLEELMYKSDKLVVLTIKVEKKLLIKRTNLKVLRAIFGLVVRKKVARVTRLKRIRRMLKMKKLYKRGFSEFLYERWFNYLLHSNIATHWLINPNDSDVIIAYPYMEDKVF